MPFFGVPLRNGVPLGLGSVAGFGTTPFTPAELFYANEQGGWYDPSDLTTMFQDAAGTTAAALESPVGLVLDKSKGLVLGSELVTNGDFSNGTTGWSSGLGSASVSLSISGGAAVLTVLSGYSANANGRYKQAISGLTIGRTYCISVGSFSATGAGDKYVGWTDQSNATAGIDWLSNHTTTRYLTATATTMYVWFGFNNATTGATITIDNISVRELPGNHLSQSTSTARPVLSARVNLLTYTEQFDNAAWFKQDATVTANAATAPDGTTTADRVVCLTTPLTNKHIRQTMTFIANASYRFSCYVKNNAGSLVVLGITASPYTQATWSFSSMSGNYEDVGNGWYRIWLDFVAPSSSFAVYIGGDYTASSLCDCYIWGADLRPSNAGVGLPAYQRVGAATSGSSSSAGAADYDATGFPYYLKFDGTDDFLASGTISPGSVDKAQVFAGVRKLSDVEIGTVVELSATTASNPGVFRIFAPNAATTASYNFRSRGSISSDATASSGYASPTTNVLTGLGDISGDLATLRLNGTQVAQTTTDQGTGNYEGYPLYVGRRGGTIYPFNGQLYSLIVRFSATNMDAATIASTETWVNQRTKAF